VFFPLNPFYGNCEDKFSKNFKRNSGRAIRVSRSRYQRHEKKLLNLDLNWRLKALDDGFITLPAALQIDLRNQRSCAGPVYARARRRTESATQDLVPRDHGTLHHIKTA